MKRIRKHILSVVVAAAICSHPQLIPDVRGVLSANQDELMSVVRATESLGWTFHLSESGELLILCQETDSGICVPVRLEQVAHRMHDGELFVDAEALASALNADVDRTAGELRLVARENNPNPMQSQPLYHADWGENRGFREGQTLPDIPLTDMDGNEVRFSQYLGKQYIIYCWASW